MPKVSAIVAVYNVPENLLKRCIESLINQTLKEIEIILVDDGTPDTSGKICDEYALLDNRIKVIHQKNKGLCGARNAGAQKASGEWITYIDGDDWLELDCYEVLYNEVKNSKDVLDVIIFGFVKDYPNKSIEMNYNKYLQNNKVYKNFEEINYLKKMTLNFNANIALVPTKFIRNEFAQQNKIYHDEKLKQGAEGIEFNIRLFSIAQKVKFIEKRFYHYVYNEESITTKHNEKNHYMVLNCFKKIKTEIDINDNEIMEWFYNRMKHVIITTAISGYFSSSNPEKYSIQKKKFQKFISEDLVKETLAYKENKNLGIAKRCTLFLIKNHMYLLVKIISKIRNYQKSGGV